MPKPDNQEKFIVTKNEEIHYLFDRSIFPFKERNPGWYEHLIYCNNKYFEPITLESKLSDCYDLFGLMSCTYRFSTDDRFKKDFIMTPEYQQFWDLHEQLTELEEKVREENELKNKNNRKLNNKCLECGKKCKYEYCKKC